MQECGCVLRAAGCGELARGEEEARCDFVAEGYDGERDAVGCEGVEDVFGVVVNLLDERVGGKRGPGCGFGLFTRIRPVVAVVEVEIYLETSGGSALSEFDVVVEVVWKASLEDLRYCNVA